MNIDLITKERQSWMKWKNIAPLRKALEDLEDGSWNVTLGDVVKISGNCTRPSEIHNVARMMMPWRKGPFERFGTYIDADWRNTEKYNLLRKHFNLKDKKVADIGCNNGYYLFRMQEDTPKLLVGFDPSPLYKKQFNIIKHSMKRAIV